MANGEWALHLPRVANGAPHAVALHLEHHVVARRALDPPFRVRRTAHGLRADRHHRSPGRSPAVGRRARPHREHLHRARHLAERHRAHRHRARRRQ